MDVADLRLFADVARRRGFAAVAEERDVDPSSVSRAIAALEAELGLRLFHRTTRTMALTEAGDLYLNRVLPAVEELERARDEATALRADPIGALRVTASVTLGQALLTPLLPAFRKAFPRVQLELLFDDANLDLVADRIDIAIRLAPNYQPNVIGVKLFETRYRVVASPDYIKREGAPKRPADISARSCVLFPMPEFRTRWLFRRGQKISEARVAGNLVLSTASAIKQAALAGLGPALLPQWLIDEDLAAKRLVDLFPAYQVAATTFDTAAWLLYPSREYLPRKVRLAIDFFRERLVMRG